jgi:hypothetical protein
MSQCNDKEEQSVFNIGKLSLKLRGGIALEEDEIEFIIKSLEAHVELNEIIRRFTHNTLRA